VTQGHGPGVIAARTIGAHPTEESESMKAVVIYESHWGNTAAVARAIAEGLGHGTQAMPTDEATDEVMKDVELIVAGAPVIAFSLAGGNARKQIAGDTKAPVPPDVSHPLLREWLDNLIPGKGWFAAFETRIWWSPRGATGTIEGKLKKAGYKKLVKAERFLVAGSYGPMKDGELERAQAWGAELAEIARGHLLD
jgi:flavodoxin